MKTRALTEVLAVVAWITSLIMVVPYQRVSLAFVLLYTRLPLSVLSRPETQFIYVNSYWLSLLSMAIASVAVILSVEIRGKALRTVIVTDIATLGVAIAFMLAFGWV